MKKLDSILLFSVSFGMLISGTAMAHGEYFTPNPNKTSNDTGDFALLPNEVLGNIFGYLKAQDLSSVALVNHRSNAAAAPHLELEYLNTADLTLGRYNLLGVAKRVRSSRGAQRLVDALQSEKLDQVEAVTVAAWAGNVVLLQKMYENGFPIDKKDQEGNTAAHVAAMNGHVEVLGFLYIHARDIFSQTSTGGQTPLRSTICFARKADGVRSLKFFAEHFPEDFYVKYEMGSEIPLQSTIEIAKGFYGFSENDMAEVEAIALRSLESKEVK